jgi:hypothetical protein
MHLRLLIPALLFVFPLFTMAQRGQISGEGDIVKQEISLEPIHSIALGFSGDVILTQGSTQKIVLEGQKNVIDNIKRDVNGGTWELHYDKSVRQSKAVKIYITLPTLRVIAVSGSGNITGTNKFTNLGNVEIVASGSGEVSLAIEAADVECAVSGSGDVHLDGSARTIEIAVSGSGNVDAQNLKTGSCEIAISGSGDALVYCIESLDAAISGSGDIRYKGNAPKVHASVHGSGDIREIE